jgi:hypothetical protein
LHFNWGQFSDKTFGSKIFKRMFNLKSLASVQFLIYFCFNILINKHIHYVINEKSNLNNGVIKQLYGGKQTVFRRNNKFCKIGLELKVKKIRKIRSWEYLCWNTNFDRHIFGNIIKTLIILWLTTDNITLISWVIAIDILLFDDFNGTNFFV